MEDVKDIASDDITNPGEMRDQKFVAPPVERVDCENSRSSSPDCKEVATNLTRMKNWKLDNLSFENIKIKNSDTSVNCVASSSTNIETSEWSLDNLSYEETIDNCPDSMTADTDKTILMTSDLRLDDYIDSDKNCESDEEEFPDEFFVFANPDDKTKSFIATKDLYPIVGCDDMTKPKVLLLGVMKMKKNSQMNSFCSLTQMTKPKVFLQPKISILRISSAMMTSQILQILM